VKKVTDKWRQDTKIQRASKEKKGEGEGGAGGQGPRNRYIFIQPALQKRNAPYNLYSFTGSTLNNYSLDYTAVEAAGGGRGGKITTHGNTWGAGERQAGCTWGGKGRAHK